MKRTTRNFLAGSLAVLLFAPVTLLAQFGFGFGAIPVMDAGANLQLASEVAKAATQVLVSQGILDSSTVQQLWSGQIFLSKLPWGVTIPASPQLSQVENTIGNMGSWGSVLANGQGARQAWQQAGVQLAGDLSVLLQQHGYDSSTAAQIAAIAAANAAGTNNLALIGQARGYLTENLPAMNGLSKTILSADKRDNGPTQQLQLLAAGTAQTNSTAVEQLQVSTGTLEAVTALTKTVADASTEDLNIRIREQQARMTEPVGVGGFASALANHP